MPYVLGKCGFAECTKAHLLPNEMEPTFPMALCSAVSEGVNFYITKPNDGSPSKRQKTSGKKKD